MNTEEIRKAYLPSSVRILLVAESPPSSGKFFYNDSDMTRYTMKAFEKAFGLKFDNTGHFLEYFRDCGCYLDDLTETPVNNLPSIKREQLLQSGIPCLSERIKRMQPTVVVTVLKKIEAQVQEAINKAGIRTEAYTLPFPGNGHQNKYIESLAEILKQHLVMVADTVSLAMNKPSVNQQNALKNEHVNVSSLFEDWRVAGRHHNEWGLAWFLAFQFCRRFYASHGIVPHVIAHEGLGYYGIRLDHVACKVNQAEATLSALGRLTMAGNVENWRTGEPGDHGLKTSELCWKGIPTEELISLAIDHMRLPIYPSKSHVNCRHKRWGASFDLIFEVATILALRNPEYLDIWNDPSYTEKIMRDLDPNANMQEHPGAFVFEGYEKTIVITGDGRLLDGSGRNLWEDYMRGLSPYSIALSIEKNLS